MKLVLLLSSFLHLRKLRLREGTQLVSGGAQTGTQEVWFLRRCLLLLPKPESNAGYPMPVTLGGGFCHPPSPYNKLVRSAFLPILMTGHLEA